MSLVCRRASLRRRTRLRLANATAVDGPGCAAVAPYDEGRIGEGEAYDGKGTGDFARFTGQDGQAVATALTAAK